jgi:hypothetical protein
MPTRKNRKNPKKRKKTKRGGGAPVNKSPKPFPLSKQPSPPENQSPETQSLPVIYQSPEGLIFMQNPFVNDNSSLILDPDITLDYEGESYSLWRVNTDDQTVYALLEPYHTTLVFAQTLVDQGAKMIYKLEGEMGQVEMDQDEIESYLYGH